MLNLDYINSLVNEKMTRRQFLIRLGFIVIGVLGLTKIFHFSTQDNKNNISGGYGATPYGGKT